MPTDPPGTKLAARLDRLYEFEREPVATNRLQSAGRFAGLYVGEHVAATEFVIGALFVSWGARTRDVLLGLLLGNLLAVLSWALVCAPIAVQTRLTLYWYLRRIAGPTVTAVYNVLNAILYCILAGAMITVSASALRLPFGIPAQTQWYPEDLRFVLVVLGVGAVVVGLAIGGFRKLAVFSSICAPWMVLMFVAGALATLPALAATVPEVGGRIGSLGDLLAVAEARIWTGQPSIPGAEPLGFAHVLVFAWICNVAMHLGLSDMALFRFARRWSYGFFSALGVYVGHYMAWVCAGIMGAAAAAAMRMPLGQLDAGAVAYHAAGVAGAIAVVVAGWTTANPTLYRAGLALQAVTPNWSRARVTLVAGAITTLIACSPFVFTRLLDFVGTYGILLAPVGGIVVAEHWLFPRLGRPRYAIERSGRSINSPALIAWGTTVAAAVYLWQTGAVHLFFLAIPAWAASGLLYTLLAPLAARDSRAPSPTTQAAPGAEDRDAVRLAPAEPEPAASPPRRVVQQLAGVLALAALVACLALPMWVYLSPAGDHAARLAAYKGWILVATLAYFVAGTLWAKDRRS